MGGGAIWGPCIILAVLIAVPLCLANVVRIATWGDISVWLRCALIIPNLGYAIGVVLLLILSE